MDFTGDNHIFEGLFPKASQLVSQNRRYQMRSFHRARFRLYQRRHLKINSNDANDEIFNIFRDLHTEKGKNREKFDFHFFFQKQFFFQKKPFFFSIFFHFRFSFHER